jgi:hemoglobin
MKKDIENRADIDDLMNRFYRRALSDEKIGYIFKIAELDLEHHLPVIGDFWETLLFGTGNYQRHGRNPLQVHAELNKKTPLFFEHFERWLEIFASRLTNLLKGRAPILSNFAPTRLPTECSVMSAVFQQP